MKVKVKARDEKKMWKKEKRKETPTKSEAIKSWVIAHLKELVTFLCFQQSILINKDFNVKSST